MGTNHFQEINIPQQKHYNDVPFPCIVSPKPQLSSLTDLIKSINSEKPYLESLLHKSGALLLRRFRVDTSSEFDDVVEAFGYDELPYVAGEALRSKIVGRVYTASESPLHLDIGLHHEMSYLSKFPSKLFFFCEVEPASGGETPIVLSHVVYERMSEKYPYFVRRLEELGIAYYKLLDEEDDPSHPAGRGWKSQFSTDDKEVDKIR